MDLEKLNKEYQGAKKDKLYASLDRMEKRLETLEKDLIAQKRQGEDAQTKKARATEDKDEARIKQAEQEIKDAKDAMEKTKKQIEKQKETITKTKGKVEKYIDEIAKDPEMKEQIDKMIAGRCKKEVKKIEDEKQQVANLQELLKKHPNVEANVVGMIHAIDEKKKLIQKKQEIRIKLNDPKTTDSEKKQLNSDLKDVSTELGKTESKYTKNQTLILACAEKSNIDVSKECIKEFFKDGSDRIAHNKDGKLNISKTLNNKIKTYDKKLKPFKTTLRNLGVQEGTRGEGERQGQNGQGTNLPATTGKPKFSWRHPFKSIKAIMAYNKSQYTDLGHIDENMENAGQQDAAQPTEPEELTPEQEEQRAREKAERNQKNREFRKALHYDVVQDYMVKRIQDLKKEDLREAATPQNKENEQNSDNAR